VTLKLTAISAAVAAALAFAAAWSWQGSRCDAAVLKLEKAQAQAVAEAERKLSEQRDATADALAWIDTHYTEKLSDAQADIARLRSDVADGARRLSVRAECPQGVPTDAAAGSVDDAASPRLTGAAERDYYRLRERIEQATAMIEGLQAYARQCSGG
jgi:prophage endopeptidase